MFTLIKQQAQKLAHKLPNPQALIPSRASSTVAKSVEPAPKVEKQKPAKKASKQNLESIIDAVLISGVVLPSYPGVLQQIDALVAKPEFSLNELAALIEKDPGLTAAVLRIANSPVFGLNKKAVNVNIAVTILGLARVTSIVRSVALREAMDGFVDTRLLETLWGRFSKIGYIAGYLCGRSKIATYADQAYTVGMFHGTGAFILAKRHPEETKPLLNAPESLLTNLERLGQENAIDLASLSGVVARSWRLPSEVIVAIMRQQHWISLEGNPASYAVLLQLAISVVDGWDAKEDIALWDYAQNELGLRPHDLLNAVVQSIEYNENKEPELE